MTLYFKIYRTYISKKQIRDLCASLPVNMFNDTYHNPIYATNIYSSIQIFILSFNKNLLKVGVAYL